MCGILGIIGLNPVHEQFLRMLTIQQNRGKDAYGFAHLSGSQSNDSIFTTKQISEIRNKLPHKSNALIGHTLHSVVSNVPQPISLKDKKEILVANCEIYNWQELAKKHNINVINDAELLLTLLSNSTKELSNTSNPLPIIKKALKDINGVYSFAYYFNEKIIIARDIIGEKPLFFAHLKKEKEFIFASESKTIREIIPQQARLIQELNPRHIICYNLKTHKISKSTRKFFTKQKETQTDEKKVVPKLSEMLVKCVKERLPAPDVKIGLLFSGGVDSALIAQILKLLGRDFTCYTAAFEDEGQGKSQDLAMAQDAAREMGLKLNETVLTLSQTQEVIKEVIPLIESSNVVKVGVALPFYVCCKQAAKDNVRVIFSGLGSEELFAGYQRHKGAADINLECISGLRKMYERDLYRDDVVTMNNTVELRLPFLDIELINYALKISGNLKIKGEQGKYILRKSALNLGLSEKYALRPKQAAQYGSRFDKAINKLASRSGFELKSAYLNTFFPPQNQKLAVLFSSGKDSAYAMYTMQRQQYPISCLITLQSKNKDSYMFHTPAIELAKMQAKTMNLPIIIQKTAGEKEEELVDLKKAIKLAIKRYNIDGIVTGALYSVYQRERIEKIAEELGIKVFSPLWHIDQEKELRQIIDSKFEIILTQVAAEGLDSSWLGRKLTHSDVDKLVTLNKKLGINIAGEGGEFESLVIDAPMFAKKLNVNQTKIHSDGGKHTLLIKSANLTKKIDAPNSNNCHNHYKYQL